MNSVMDKVRVAEKRYRAEIKKGNKEKRLNTRKHKKRYKKLKKTIKSIIIDYKNRKRQQNWERKSNTKQIRKELYLANKMNQIREQNKMKKKTKK